VNATVALVCARGGNMPADCSQSPVIGRWAGKRVLVQGDYAEDGDIPGWDGPPLSLLYHAMDGQEARDSLTAHRKQLQEEGHDYGIPDWSKLPIYADISREARDFLEGICNVRYFEQEQVCTDGDRKSPTYGQVISRWTNTNWVTVRPLARQFGDIGVGEYVLDPCYKASDLEYLKRLGMRPEDVMRPPRSGDWHGLTPEAAEGQRRVIVNLDTLEYIDPVKFGQLPTLAGMTTTAPRDRNLPVLKKAAKDNHELVDVAGGLFAMLCHSKRRGGGDLPAGDLHILGGDPRNQKSHLFKGATDVKGRWRGGRILGTCEIRYEDWPTTEEVIERGTDISDKVIRYLVALTHY
jgi:hypothetical protein